MKLNSWIREVEFVNSWSWIHEVEFVKLNSGIREVEIVISWSWNREFVKLKPWINEVEMTLPVFRKKDTTTVSLMLNFTSPCDSSNYVVRLIMPFRHRSAKRSLNITKTYLYNFAPLKPHLYIVKLGFTWVYIIFLISAQNKDCGYSLEPPRRGGSNEYPQSMFWAEMWKISDFLSEKSWVFWWWNFQYICIGMFS